MEQKKTALKIAFIGGGAMGEAMLSALLDKRLSTPRDITVSDIAEARRQYLAQKYGVTVTAENEEAVYGKAVIVLAIKPQNLNPVMTELKGQLKPVQLVVSIIAGARIVTLSSELSHKSIVRVMPNTPAQIGEGMSVWTATAEVTKQQKEWAASILGAMGKAIYVEDEKYLDMATAISGSGPAYVFLFMESLIDTAVHIGIPSDMARELVFQTVLGSAHFAQKSDKSLAELRRMVTSPGGTTAEALAQFEKGNFTDLVLRAVVAAYDKAKKLGG